MTAQPFPWARAMAFGFGVLQLSPEQFWSMTPRELAAAMSAYGLNAGPQLQRSDLDALMARFPDRA